MRRNLLSERMRLRERWREIEWLCSVRHKTRPKAPTDGSAECALSTRPRDTRVRPFSLASGTEGGKRTGPGLPGPERTCLRGAGRSELAAQIGEGAPARVARLLHV